MKVRYLFGVVFLSGTLYTLSGMLKSMIVNDYSNVFAWELLLVICIVGLGHILWGEKKINKAIRKAWKWVEERW